MDQAGMRRAILDFSVQLSADLPAVGLGKLPPTDKFIVCGLGGSALAAGLLRVYRPELDLLIHRDYGLPRVPGYFLEGSLLILSSYSCATEEVLDTFRYALGRRLSVAVLASGGQLLAEAKRLNLPYILLPGGLPPRLASGYSFAGLCRLIVNELSLAELRTAAEVLNPSVRESAGEQLANLIGGRLPIVYSSTVNLPLAYYWKISFNETGKTASFYNVLPEMNHNELAAVADSHFFYIFLRDPADDPRIKKRFDRLAALFRNQGQTVEEVVLPDRSPLEKIFSAVILADWAAYYLAIARGHDPVATPTIENFKKDVFVG